MNLYDDLIADDRRDDDRDDIGWFVCTDGCCEDFYEGQQCSCHEDEAMSA